MKDRKEEVPRGASGKEPPCQCSRWKRHRCDPWTRKIPWRREWQPTPVFLPRESHEQRAYGQWGPKESDSTEHLRFFVLSGVAERTVEVEDAL